MPITLPVAAPVSPSSDVPSSLAPSAQGRANTRDANVSLPDGQIFDLAVRQATSGDGGRLANPGALAGEVVEALRGFFERGNRASAFIAGARSHAPNAVLFADASRPGELGSTLHRGPAQESLEPIGTNYSKENPNEVEDPREITERVTDELLNAAMFDLQSTLVASTAGHVSSSINTLLRSQ
jgi:hypothetical protein